MERRGDPYEALDTLAQRARDGDRNAADRLYEELRVRLLRIAKRRVREEDAEDLVQEAIQIVHTRHRAGELTEAVLVWSMAVLRNRIGNYYQRRARRAGEEPFEEERHATGGSPLADILGAEMRHQVLTAVEVLSERWPRCGVLFRRILESLTLGGEPAEVTRRALGKLRGELEGLSAGALYVALHRCRGRLRVILEEIETGGAS